MSGIHFIHVGESLYVHEIDIHFHHVGERFVRCLQDHFEVVEDLLRLGGHAALDEFSRGRVLCDLTARIHTVAIANGRRKWTDGFGQTVGRNGVERHVNDCVVGGRWSGMMRPSSDIAYLSGLRYRHGCFNTTPDADGASTAITRANLHDPSDCLRITRNILA